MHRLTAALLFAFSAVAAAAPPAGQLDPAFGVNGVSTFGFDLGGDNHDTATALVRDTEGRLYLIGTASFDSETCLAIARYLPDGKLDAENYGESGHVCLNTLPGGIGFLKKSDAIVQANGMLLVAGVASGASAWPVVCRINTAGHLDEEFGATTTPGCVAFENITVGSSVPDGAPTGFSRVDMALGVDRIFLTIMIGSLDGVQLGRLSADGEIIPFGQNPTRSIFTLEDKAESATTSDIAVTANGMLAISGAMSTPESNGWDFFVARIDPDTGVRDPTFNGNGLRRTGFDRGGENHDVPTALALTPDGGIVVAGAAQTADLYMRPAVAMLTNSGALAGQFNDGASATYNPCMVFDVCDIFVTGLELVEDGKIFLSGYDQQDGFAHMFMMRLRSDGASDASYGPNFPAIGYAVIPGEFSQITTALVLQDGRPVLGGRRDTGGAGGYDFLIARLSDGRLFRDGFDEAP